MMNRRRFLTATTVAGTLAVAGCLGDDDGNGGDGNGDDSTGNGENPGGNGDDSTGNGTDNGTGNGDPPAEGPEAAFAVDPMEPEVGQSVTFDAGDSTGDITAYRWDFTGDGEPDETGETVSHSFEESGTATVTLEVENADGETGETSRDVQVAPEPIAAFEWDPAGPRVGETITFDGSASAGSIASYQWDFDGDGEIDDTGETVSYTFEEPGEQFVELEVESVAGTVDDAIFSVEVSSAPRATFTWSPEEPAPGQAVEFDASETLGDILRYEWDFTGNGEFDEATEDPTITHTFENGGDMTVILNVVAENGKMDSVGETVSVTQDRDIELTAQFGFEPEPPTVGEEVSFDGGFSIGDIVEYRWDFDGDGEFETVTGEPVTTFSFDGAGETTVTLVVENADGETAEDSEPVLVQTGG
jgi:PKD repeat protein